MDILYLLIPVALALLIVMVLVFNWSVKSGQYDDLEGPAYRILMDDDDAPKAREKQPASKSEKRPKNTPENEKE